MTDFVNPTIEDETKSDNAHAACGPASCASVIIDALKGPVTVTQVNDWIATNFGDTTQGVPLSWLQAALAHWGVASTIRTGSMRSIVDAAIAAKHEVIIWHQCNGCADPVNRYASSTSHYRVAYGSVVTMNPGYAFCGRAPLENVDCSIGDMGSHLEIMEVLPKDQPIKETPMAGGSFRPGTHEYHWTGINADKTVEHFYTDLDKGMTVSSENLGGVAGGPASVTWSSDGLQCVIEVIGSDGTSICLNVWTGGKWSGWTVTAAKTVQFNTGGVSLDQVKAEIGAAKLTPS